MKVEIAEAGRMTQSGSSLLRLIQNNNMPILDLLVRESVQNSLDAYSRKDIPVVMEYNTGEFLADELNKELEGVEGKLDNRFKDTVHNYISISDKNTKGLTGPIHYNEVRNNKYGNLLKLIYEISKPQEEEGAGGSWGLGKTIYFRIGIGLVLYYSRICVSEGRYEERFAASYVEDENSKDAILPEKGGKPRRGIAWWGEEDADEEGKTVPVTDSDYIEKILNIFDMNPYQGQETGTRIIIPYVDYKKLLKDNVEAEEEEEGRVSELYWYSDIEEYLKIAVQRWYAPRLNNKEFPYGSYLNVKINDKYIGEDCFMPFFKVIQCLHKRAYGGGGNELLDEVEDTYSEEIKTRNVFSKGGTVGTISFTKVTKEILGMCTPNNNPSPFELINYIHENSEKNKPIICFARKPGMVVSYEIMGKWVEGILPTDADEFIIGFFVPNSKNEIKFDEMHYSLEEYLRKGEKADHTSWSDHSNGNANPGIVRKIQSGVIKKINNKFYPDEEKTQNKYNSGLGKLFGDLLLPPQNFGNAPGNGTRSENRGGSTMRHKKMEFVIDERTIRYTPEGIYIQAESIVTNKAELIDITMDIASESGRITMDEWLNTMGMMVPFQIVQVRIESEKFGDVVYELNSQNESVEHELVQIGIIEGDRKNGLGIRIIPKILEEIALQLKFEFLINLRKKDVRPVFNFNVIEGE